MRFSIANHVLNRTVDQHDFKRGFEAAIQRWQQLLTDDGALAHDILSPAHHVEKQYVVTLDTPLTDAMRRGFAAGVTLTDGETMAPAGVEPLTDDGLTVQVTLRQGVYHQIKRMFGVFDAGVNALHRESIGGVALDPALAPGQWRELTEEEVERLQNVK